MAAEGRGVCPPRRKSCQPRDNEVLLYLLDTCPGQCGHFQGIFELFIGGGFVFVFLICFGFFFLLVRFSWPRKTLVGISFLPTGVSN